MSPAELLSHLEATRQHGRRGAYPDSADSHALREAARRDEVVLVSALAIADAIRYAKPETQVITRWAWTTYAFLITLLVALVETYALVRILGGAP